MLTLAFAVGRHCSNGPPVVTRIGLTTGSGLKGYRLVGQGTLVDFDFSRVTVRSGVATRQARLDTTGRSVTAGQGEIGGLAVATASDATEPVSLYGVDAVTSLTFEGQAGPTTIMANRRPITSLTEP